jgi:hypothetical protein
MENLPYLIANQETTSSSGNLSNLYNDEEQTKVNEAQRRSSLVAFEERENQLKKAEQRIDKSKVLKRDTHVISTRLGLRKEILASNNEDLVVPRDRKRFEKALANGKSKNSKSQAYSAQDSGTLLPPKRTRTTRAVIDSLVRSFSHDALRIHDGGEEETTNSDKPNRKGDSSGPFTVSNSSKKSSKPRQ